MISDVEKTNLKKDLAFLNNKINICQTTVTMTKNLDLKINLMHLINQYIEEREIIINKLQKIFGN